LRERRQAQTPPNTSRIETASKADAPAWKDPSEQEKAQPETGQRRSSARVRRIV